MIGWTIFALILAGVALMAWGYFDEGEGGAIVGVLGMILFGLGFLLLVGAGIWSLL